MSGVGSAEPHRSAGPGSAGAGASEHLLAAWAAGVRWGDVPDATQATVEDIFLDAIASGLAGRDRDLVARVTPAARSFAADSHAADTFLYAYAITSATVCDVYRPGLCHVTPVVLPPLAALAGELESSREEVLAAFTVGLEVTVRLSAGLGYPRLRANGWHSPGVIGPVGAAAAAAHLLGLGAIGIANAMAHGSAQAAGTFASLGTEAVKFNQARGSVSGLLAALMAQAGVSASDRWLSDPDGGLAHSYAGGALLPGLTDKLGERWELEDISLRCWPAASSVQSLIEVMLELDVAADDVSAVLIELGAAAYEVSGERGWYDQLSAQQSARWVTSAVLHDRDWWLEQSSSERIADLRLGSFAAERVRVSAAADLGHAGVRVRVDLHDGHELGGTRQSALGDPDRPLTRTQIEQKLRRAASADVADEAIARLSNDERGPIAPLFRLVRPGAPA